MVTIEIKPYDALPCHCEKFTINGIDADMDDFGGTCDMCSDLAEPYGCGDRQFISKMPTDEVLKKYSISLKDYSDICDELSVKFDVGSCGWCI